MFKWLRHRLKQRRRRERLDAEYDKLMLNNLRLELKASKHTLHSLRERRDLEKLIRERKHERGYIV